MKTKCGSRCLRVADAFLPSAVPRLRHADDVGGEAQVRAVARGVRLRRPQPLPRHHQHVPLHPFACRQQPLGGATAWRGEGYDCVLSPEMAARRRHRMPAAAARRRLRLRPLARRKRHAGGATACRWRHHVAATTTGRTIRLRVLSPETATRWRHRPGSDGAAKRTISRRRRRA